MEDWTGFTHQPEASRRSAPRHVERVAFAYWRDAVGSELSGAFLVLLGRRDGDGIVGVEAGELADQGAGSRPCCQIRVLMFIPSLYLPDNPLNDKDPSLRIRVGWRLNGMLKEPTTTGVRG